MNNTAGRAPVGTMHFYLLSFANQTEMNTILEAENYRRWDEENQFWYYQCPGFGDGCPTRGIVQDWEIEGPDPETGEFTIIKTREYYPGVMFLAGVWEPSETISPTLLPYSIADCVDPDPLQLPDGMINLEVITSSLTGGLLPGIV